MGFDKGREVGGGRWWGGGGEQCGQSSGLLRRRPMGRRNSGRKVKASHILTVDARPTNEWAGIPLEERFLSADWLDSEDIKK